jgi:hypothetical protein
VIPIFAMSGIKEMIGGIVAISDSRLYAIQIGLVITYKSLFPRTFSCREKAIESPVNAKQVRVADVRSVSVHILSQPETIELRVEGSDKKWPRIVVPDAYQSPSRNSDSLCRLNGLSGAIPSEFARALEEARSE